MELFKHILTAMLVGAVLVGVWLGLYALALGLIWITEHLSFVWVMAVIAFIAGTVFYLLDVPYV